MHTHTKSDRKTGREGTVYLLSCDHSQGKTGLEYSACEGACVSVCVVESIVRE